MIVTQGSITKLKPIAFFAEVKSELQKVVWPNRQETIRLTGIVIIISSTVAIFIGVLDYTLISLTGLIFK